MDRPEGHRRAAWICGLLGLIPFWALPVGLVSGALPAERLVPAVALYAALIVSFLGGARWGLALGGAAPRPIVLAASMAPTLVVWFVLLLGLGPRVTLLALAAALAGAGVWDARSPGLEDWYRRLRLTLTSGAAAALALGALLVK